MIRPHALLLATALAAAAPLAARAGDGLPGPSPFLPAAGSAPAAATPDAPIELRGVVTNEGKTLFSIYDTTRKTSDWVGLNETGHAFTVQNYDEAHDTVTVNYQGRTLTLALHTAKVASAPVAFPAQNQALISPPPPAPQPIGGPVVLHPSPADEKRRLEEIAAEVNRRRMLRQQALQASRRAAEQGQQAGRPVPVRPNQR
ncbi:MAG TPA: hypothetical protein VG710_06590 [Opitutus sp.]|nr:hypothetical protein [Opitutus sp.]